MSKWDMDNTPEDFNDPALAAALKRLEGGHVTRPDLRDRVTQALTAAADESRVARKPRRWIPYAAAACLLLAAGAGIAWHIAEVREQERYLADNRVLVGKMISAGDQAATQPAVTAAVDAKALKADLEKKCGIVLPNPDLTKAGWTLQSGACVKIDETKTARFEFSKGDQRVMLISFHHSMFQGAQDGEAYEFVSDGHPIAGFVSNCVLHCVVGGSGMTLADAETLRDQIRGQ